MNFTQDPDAVLDYSKDIGAWLAAEGSDTVASFTVTADTGFTVASGSAETFATTYDVTSPTAGEQAGALTYWAAGGTLDQSYKVTLHVTTAAGREEDFTDVFTITQH